MNLFEKYGRGLPYADFIARYANEAQKQRWHAVHQQVALTAAQRELLGAFRRSMPALCLAGAWCGDCVNQCPIFDHFAIASPRVQVRYFDRDANPDLGEALSVCGGARVPVVLFLSERHRSTAVFRNDTAPTQFETGDTLTIPDVLPGFSVPVARFFE